MKASDLFIQALGNESVEFIFGVPGEENLDSLDSLSRSKIRLILTRHEQAAGFPGAKVNDAVFPAADDLEAWKKLHAAKEEANVAGT